MARFAKLEYVFSTSTTRTVPLAAVAATTLATALVATSLTIATPASAEPYALASTGGYRSSPLDRYIREEREPDAQVATPAHLRRQMVSYAGSEASGTIVVDTPNTQLYLVLGGGRAIRYGIGIGREGFTWSGTQTITRMSEWPDWNPPPEMIGRQPYLPRFMAGGPGNPLGARAMYLGSTVYRIHGTNDPTTIGRRVSSGCIRLSNEDVIDLYSRVRPGTRVVVLPMSSRRSVSVSPRDAAPARTAADSPFRSNLY